MSAVLPTVQMARPWGEAQRLVLAFGLTLAGLWVIRAQPADGALLVPLNLLTAQATASMLAWIGLPVVREFAVLTHAGGFSCEIYHACTALIPIMLLAAAILPQRRSWRARWSGVLIGTLLLFVLNQVRLVSLVWIGVQAPTAFDAAHAWLWPLLLTLATAGYGFGWSQAMQR